MLDRFADRRENLPLAADHAGSVKQGGVDPLEREFGERGFLADGENHAVMQRHVGDREDRQVVIAAGMEFLQSGLQLRRAAPRSRAGRAPRLGKCSPSSPAR